MSTIQLSPTQNKILQMLLDWFKARNSPYITLGGYAGTGKSTIVGYFRNLLHQDNPNLRVAFCSYTGKATRVLKQKLTESLAIYPADSVSTIHALMYAPVINADKEITGWRQRGDAEIEFDLLIIDEASMVNGAIWNDLLTYEIPILAVGDHGQLPPIEGAFNLMESPQLKLEEIYRQEQDNPIIKLSMLARTEGEIPFGKFGRHVQKLDKREADTHEVLGDLFARFNNETLVLVGYNNTRVKLNKAIRQILEFSSPLPSPRDRVICLRNNRTRQIYNGMLGTIEHISHEGENTFFKADVQLDGEDDLYVGKLAMQQFNSNTTLTNERRDGVDLFDFGYALTVHKAQGSQAKTVVLFEERFQQMDDATWKKWLYTAVTRAREELYIIG